MVDVLELVEARLRMAFGEPDGRAAVTFLGTERIEVLRFTDADAGVVRYATLGMSREPMTDPAGPSSGHHPSTSRFPAPLSIGVADPLRGPRAELVLSLRADRAGADTDKLVRPLAVLAASPQVEGVVVAPGNSLDIGEPLWPGAPFSAVLVAEPGGLVEDLALDEPREPVRFFPLLPMTHTEAAWKRVHGAGALQERWLKHGTDLRDPSRGAVPLG